MLPKHSVNQSQQKGKAMDFHDLLIFDIIGAVHDYDEITYRYHYAALHKGEHKYFNGSNTAFRSENVREVREGIAWACQNSGTHTRYEIMAVYLRYLPYMKDWLNTFSGSLEINGIFVRLNTELAAAQFSFRKKNRGCVDECGCKMLITQTDLQFQVCKEHSEKMLDVMIHENYFVDKSSTFLAKFRKNYHSWKNTKLTDNDSFNELRFEFAELLYTGVSPKNVLKKFGINVNRFKLTNAECMNVMKKLSRGAYNGALRGNYSDTVAELLLQPVYGDKLRYNTVRRVKNRTAVNWLIKKADQLLKERTRVVNDREITYQYISRFDEFSPRMLKNGEKTSVDYVIEEMARISQLKMYKKHKNSTFPPAPVEETDEIKYISTPQELKDEGESMQHCAGSYVDECAEGRSFIYHVKVGNTHSTLELSGRQGKLRLAQHYSTGNSRPAKRNEEAVNEWCKTHGIKAY